MATAPKHISNNAAACAQEVTVASWGGCRHRRGMSANTHSCGPGVVASSKCFHLLLERMMTYKCTYILLVGISSPPRENRGFPIYYIFSMRIQIFSEAVLNIMTETSIILTGGSCTVLCEALISSGATGLPRIFAPRERETTSLQPGHHGVAWQRPIAKRFFQSRPACREALGNTTPPGGELCSRKRRNQIL